MSLSAPQLWDAWRESSEIRALAEGWITRPGHRWTHDDEALYEPLHREPDKMLSVIFGIMQLTDGKEILGSLAAGSLEDFLGVHGETYVGVIHALALEHRRLREVLNGVWQGSMSKKVWRRIEILKQQAFT